METKKEDFTRTDLTNYTTSNTSLAYKNIINKDNQNCLTETVSKNEICLANNVNNIQQPNLDMVNLLHNWVNLNQMNMLLNFLKQNPNFNIGDGSNNNNQIMGLLNPFVNITNNIYTNASDQLNKKEDLPMQYLSEQLLLNNTFDMNNMIPSNNNLYSNKNKVNNHLNDTKDCEADLYNANSMNFIDKKTKRESKTAIICPHPEKKHYAKGMCSNCYHSHGRNKRAWKCEHKNKAHYALGICQNCYQTIYSKSKKSIDQSNEKEGKDQ